MAVIEINLDPSQQELKWFGLILFVLFGLIGGIVLWYSESFIAPIVLWFLGALLCTVYYLVRPFRRPMYLGWMHLIFPIGWTISHFLFAVIYYLLFTPIGLIMRVCGRDPIQRCLIPSATTYWVKHKTDAEFSRYFRQY